MELDQNDPAYSAVLLSIRQTDALANAIIEMADGDEGRAMSIAETVRDHIAGKIGDCDVPHLFRDVVAGGALRVTFCRTN